MLQLCSLERKNLGALLDQVFSEIFYINHFLSYFERISSEINLSHGTDVLDDLYMCTSKLIPHCYSFLWCKAQTLVIFNITKNCTFNRNRSSLFAAACIGSIS